MVSSAMILALLCLVVVLCSTALKRRTREQIVLARISRQRVQRSIGTQPESGRTYGA